MGNTEAEKTLASALVMVPKSGGASKAHYLIARNVFQEEIGYYGANSPRNITSIRRRMTFCLLMGGKTRPTRFSTHRLCWTRREDFSATAHLECSHVRCRVHARCHCH
jgi:hypothetical protein